MSLFFASVVKLQGHPQTVVAQKNQNVKAFAGKNYLVGIVVPHYAMMAIALLACKQ
jgi:hypothetical protein